jgi:hypothetical protein
VDGRDGGLTADSSGYAGDLDKDGRADVVTEAGAKVLVLLNRTK